MTKTLYVLYVGDTLIMTTNTLEKAKDWKNATTGGVIYEATLREYRENCVACEWKWVSGSEPELIEHICEKKYEEAK